MTTFMLLIHLLCETVRVIIVDVLVSLQYIYMTT